MKFGHKGIGVGDIGPVAIALVIAVITVGVGAQVTGTISQSMVGNSSAQLAVNNGTAGINQLATYFPIIGLVLAAAIIIGVVWQSFTAV